MTAKKRIINYLKYKGISQYEFSRRTGLSNGYLNSGDNVTTANLDVITNAFVDLNLMWVVKGTGSMIVSESKGMNPYNLGVSSYSQILNEDPSEWNTEDDDMGSKDMSNEQLSELNNVLRKILKAKDEIIQAKDERIIALEQLIHEKDKSSKVKDQLITQLKRNKPKGDS